MIQNTHLQDGDDSTGNVTPYREPDSEAGHWPAEYTDKGYEWTQTQKKNWLRYARPVYSNLEYEDSNYWYRRTWRPKVHHDGMMQRDHVTLGTPEDYLAETVASELDPTYTITSKMMRKVGGMKADTGVLKRVVADIVSATHTETDSTDCPPAANARRLARHHNLGVEVEG